MSTFSGLNGALTSLMTQRRALEVAGQNISNVNTPGYTRQRAELVPIDSTSAPSMHTNRMNLNGGVAIETVSRLGDALLEARVQEETASAGQRGALATAWSAVEGIVNEPGDRGVAAKLDAFFAGWQDVANRTDDPAARAVLLENGRSAAEAIAGGYRATAAEWTATRTQADSLTSRVNALADTVADLNAQIRTVVVAGGSPNALLDERSLAVTELSGLVGAQGRQRPDGTFDVMVGGNALVRGDRSHHVGVHGALTVEALAAWDPAGPTGPLDGPPRLVWTDSARAVDTSGGKLAGALSALAPADPSGGGGPLATLAARYDALALDLAAKVNAIHATGVHLDHDPAAPDPATDFFTVSAGPPGPPPALSLQVAVTDVRHVRAALEARGPLDGSVADSISLLSEGFAAQWSQVVVDTGVRTSTALQRADASESARANADAMLQAQTGVNLDEETLNLVASQRAYEAAARVISAIDEMLDTLINRTGRVGR